MSAISAIPIWINESYINEFPEEYQILASEIGFDNMLKTVALNQGTSVYYPRLDNIIARVRNGRILKEFNGKNHKQLAIKYGLTERWIYDILKRKE